MQKELRDLQPELIKTSKETELLMTKIEKDTVEAEAKKEVLYTCVPIWFTLLMRRRDTMCIVQLHVHVSIVRDVSAISVAMTTYMYMYVRVKLKYMYNVPCHVY